MGFQNRLLVSMQWLWRYLTYERGARLIAVELSEAPGGGGEKADAGGGGRGDGPGGPPPVG